MPSNCPASIGDHRCSAAETACGLTLWKQWLPFIIRHLKMKSLKNSPAYTPSRNDPCGVLSWQCVCHSRQTRKLRQWVMLWSVIPTMFVLVFECEVASAECWAQAECPAQGHFFIFSWRYVFAWLNFLNCINGRASEDEMQCVHGCLPKTLPCFFQCINVTKNVPNELIPWNTLGSCFP